MNNWFSIGERILLISQEHPEFNGEYEIILIQSDTEDHPDPHYGHMLEVGFGEGYLYYLDDPKLFQFDEDGEKVSICWHVSALRKKHKPSSEDFQSMMDTLKTNIAETV